MNLSAISDLESDQNTLPTNSQSIIYALQIRNNKIGLKKIPNTNNKLVYKQEIQQNV